jgi:hypothetical protein
MAVKSSNQITLIDLTDAYSVILTNDNHTWIGDTDSVKNTQSTTTQVMALCGSEQVPCTVGTISPPNGISAVSDGKSPAPTITITATSALTTGGSFNIPIVVDGGITLNKVFSWGIAFTGAQGSKGATGATGTGISSTAVTYQSSTSGTTVPTGTWNSNIPSVAAGSYLWTKTVTTYTDGTSTTAYSVGMMGAKGSTGSAGKGVSSTAITYQKSSSGTSAPTGTWSGSVPSASAGEYIWTRTVITYTDSTTSTSYSVGMIGATGAKGDKGDTGATGAAGADAISLVVTSSAGTIFKNTNIATTLTVHVYKAGTEVTGSALSALGTIKWYKDGSSTAAATGQTLTITAGDVSNKVSYEARLEA